MANQMANKPEKSNSRWTENDDLRLIELTQKGSTTAKVATELGRTRSSIWARKCKLNLGDVRLQHSRGTNVSVSKRTSKNSNSVPKETREKKNTFSEINLDTAARIAKKHGLNLTVITFHP